MYTVFISALMVKREVNLEEGQITELHDAVPVIFKSVASWKAFLNKSACGYTYDIVDVPDEDMIALVVEESDETIPENFADQKRLVTQEILVKKVAKMTPKFKTVRGEMDEDGKMLPDQEVPDKPLFEKTSQAYKDKLAPKPAPPEKDPILPGELVGSKEK